MRKKRLLLWTFLQLFVVVAFTQPNIKERVASLKIQEAERPADGVMERQLRMLQKQALGLTFTPVVSEGTEGQEEDGKKIYGFLEYDKQITDKGIVEFSLDNLRDLSFLYKTNGFTISAGAYADGKYYYYAYAVIMGHTLPLGFYAMDLVSGEANMIKDYSSMSMLYGDMTFDYATNTMWAYSQTDDGPVLLSVVLSTGDYEIAAVLSRELIALAADSEGLLYGIDKTGNLCSVGKIDGEISVIGATGISPAYLQSMEFDRNNNVLYWAASTSADEGLLVKIDTRTGRGISLGTVGNSSQLLGLYIPYVPSELKAPAAPSDLAVDATGYNNEVLLTWINPAKDVGGNDLQELSRVQIYRNNEKIKTIDNPVAGGQAGYRDVDVPSGLITYAVTAFNEAGESPVASVSKFIGRDVPAAPATLSVEKAGDNTILISWDAPSEGMNGGWIDTQTLVYKITRYPDNTVLADALAGTRYEDTGITEYNSYYYTIQTVSIDGAGGTAVTAEIRTGNPYPIPYSCAFGVSGDFDKWMVTDANCDGKTWHYYMQSAQYKYSLENAADDWLVSPPVVLEKGKAYRMSFDVVTGGMPEKLRVTFGENDRIEAQSVVLDDEVYTSTEQIRKVVYFPEQIESGNCHVGFYVHSDSYQFYIAVNNILIEESTAGEIRGCITSNSLPVEGCEVLIKGTGCTGVTDVSGNYRIANVEAGSYTLAMAKTGYEMVEQQVTVEEKKVSQVDCSLVALPRYSITGTIIDGANTPVKNLEITISGYAAFKATTDINGRFTFTDVYRADAYTLDIRDNIYYPYSCPFDLTGNLDLGTVTLTGRTLPPYGVVTSGENNSRLVTWEKPVAPIDLRYDNGTAMGQLGIYSGDDKSVCGNIYRIPMLLNSISWYLTAEGGTRDRINIYIFALDETGEPTNRIIYAEKNVPTGMLQWCTYYFREEVYAPDGFMVALSVEDGYLSVGIDSGTEDYPFLEHTQCITEDYLHDGFTYIEPWNTENKNLMIRANGFPTAGVAAPQTASVADLYTYDVWRFEKGKEADEAYWTLLSSSRVADTLLSDSQWNVLPQGVYRYAVKSVSQDGIVSVPSFSETVDKDMFTRVTVHINTNTSGKSADGAVVTFYNEQNSYTDTVRLDNRLSFTLWKGVYSMKAEMPGYSTLLKNDIDYSTENSYDSENYILEEIIEMPFNVTARKTGIAGERLLKWDYGLFDNFELHPDFTINSPGNVGWTYIDGDQSETYGSAMYEFPGMKEKMAYIVMNSLETAPGDTAAHSGYKYLADFAAESGRNNDFIISPQLKAEKDFILSLWARSYEGVFGLETFRIGYSVTHRKTEDFIWLEDGKRNPPVMWTYYEFMIPGNARYVTVNCISMGTYLLMLDDIFIDAERAEPGQEKFYSYEVYLNDDLLTRTEDHSVLLQELAKGEYKVSVRRAYSSGVSDFNILNFTVTDDESRLWNTENDIDIYPNPVSRYLYIKGMYTSVRVIDPAGKLMIEEENTGDCIYVGSLPEGFYFVQVVDKNKVTLRKIVVKKRHS